MFNLLTEPMQQKLSREYRWRLVAVACLVLAGEVFAATLGGLFSFQALQKEAALVRGGETANEKTNSVAESDTARIIERTNARLALLAEPPPLPLSPGVDGLLSARVSGIRLVSIAAEADAEGGWTLTAQGVALTRDALALFERTLVARREFTNVSIPVESFAKGAQAPFTLRVLYRAPHI